MTDITLSTDLQNRLAGWFVDREAITPSINYAVFDRQGIVFHHGVGEFNRDGRAPRLDTVYRICSMSKSFLVACVLVLRDQGLLSLGDPVRQYVPQFPDHADSGRPETPVTIEMLMNNSSGLPEDNAWADYHLSMSRDTLLATLAAGLSFSSSPGIEYQYSNIGFAVLGLVVENVSGTEFSEFAERTLLQPLGLTDTVYDPADYDDRGADVEIASGFQSFDDGATWFNRPFVETGAFACAGALFSTLNDVARWSGWLSSAWDVDNQDDAILSRASRRSMQRLTVPINLVDRVDYPATGNLGYGYGLNLEEDLRFGTIAQHSGGLPGFSGNMRWHCSSGIGIAVLANTNGQKTWSWAAEMLREVLLEVSPPARDIVLWRSTVEAAEAIDDLVTGHRTFEDLGHVFSPNVLSDIPADLRTARLNEAVELSGGFASDRPLAPLEQRWEWAVSAAQLCWQIPAATGSIECRIEMTEDATEPRPAPRHRSSRRSSGLGCRDSLLPPASTGSALMNLTGWPELSTADLDTPVLVVDRRRLEANLIAMSSATTRHDVRLRPHVKTHKSVTIAQMQIEHGATGLTVATVGEAETFCAAGFTDLFIAYPVRASPAKAGRLHDVARAASLRVGVDSVSSAVLLAQQLADSVELVIEVDSGGHRTGVSTPEEACEIADAARAHGGNVVGVFTHGGHSYARPGIADAVATQEVAALTEAASALDAAGHEISVLSAGSTPTAVAAAGSPVTEVRPGTYVFQDRLQVHLGTCSDGEVSLRVASTVVSRNRDHAVLDAGAKTLSKDVPAGLTGHGSIIEHPTLSITTLYDHHAIVTGPASDLPDLGDVVWIVPNHVCPVVDLSPDLLAIGADGTQERGPSMPGAAPGDSRNNPDATHPNHESRRTPMPLIRMFVNGQAMTGGSLHHALKDATFLGPARTAPAYRFYSFHDVFPGLQPVSEGGFAVPGELYELTYEMLRTELLPKEPAELELTIIELDDGSGSLCMKVREGSTDAEGVVDISARGGWHQHLEQPS